jgi:hypothetical protein
MPQARFPKPSFAALLASYSTDPESVHDCPFLYKKNPVSVNTCALRMGEALVISTGLIASREAITALTRGSGNGRSFLLGPYGYAANLCPHGISRGPRDLGDFLRGQWGSPERSWDAQAAPDTAPDDAMGLTGVVVFVGIPGYAGQGHVDLWNCDAPVGHAYWNVKKSFLWKLA